MMTKTTVTERCIRRDIREKLKWIESHPNWQQHDRFSSAHYALIQARNIVRKHFRQTTTL
jgi:hypothetical protein